MLMDEICVKRDSYIELTNILKTHLNSPPNNKTTMVSIQCIDCSPNFPNCKKYHFNCLEFNTLVKNYNSNPNNKISYPTDLKTVSIMDNTNIHIKHSGGDINRLLLF
jgi:hypothetical protein